MRRFASLACIPFLLAAGGAASSAAEVVGEITLWGYGIVPSDVLIDSATCDSGGTQYCQKETGGGGYAALQVPLVMGWSVMGDLRLDYHEEMTLEASAPADNASYVGTGLHLLKEAGDTTFGVFGVHAQGDNHNVSDNWGPAYGFGGEVRYDHVFLQGGYMFGTNDEDDTVDELYFIRLGGEREIAGGTVDAAVAYGFGDLDGQFNTDLDEEDDSQWGQIELAYERPLAETGIHGFIGYQGDYVHILSLIHI